MVRFSDVIAFTDRDRVWDLGEASMFGTHGHRMPLPVAGIRSTGAFGLLQNPGYRRSYENTPIGATVSSSGASSSTVSQEPVPLLESSHLRRWREAYET